MYSCNQMVVHGGDGPVKQREDIGTEIVRWWTQTTDCGDCQNQDMGTKMWYASLSRVIGTFGVSAIIIRLPYVSGKLVPVWVTSLDQAHSLIASCIFKIDFSCNAENVRQEFLSRTTKWMYSSFKSLNLFIYALEIHCEVGKNGT